MNDLISIITPCHNSEATLAETINSVIGQSYPHWELLLVNDGSTDGTERIATEYAARDKRIKYMKTDAPSGSPSKPRNIGLEIAKGKYIAFLDADDLWLPGKLVTQLLFFEKHKCKVVYSYYEKMDADGTRNGRIVRTRDKCDYSRLLRSNHIPCLTAIFERSILGDTRFRQISQEDFCFWLDLLRKGHVAYNCMEVTALYRIMEHSRSSNKLNMFMGFWNVIRKFQHVSFIKSCFYMMTYTVLGLRRFLT